MAAPTSKASGKKITRVVKLQLMAGKATPAPPVGTCLGPLGINIAGFCADFNKQTQGLEAAPYPVEVTVYSDRTFTFIIKLPPVSFYLKKKANITQGAKKPGSRTDGVAGRIAWKDILEIASLKKEEMGCFDVEAAAKTIAGSAKSMGLIVDGPQAA